MRCQCVLVDASGRAVRSSCVACHDVVVELAKVQDVDVIRYNLETSFFMPFCVSDSKVS